jgi:hypothetical protein
MRELRLREYFNASLGRSVYLVWALRKKVAGTRRPLATRLLSRLVRACSLVLIAEGALTGRADGNGSGGGPGATARTTACGLAGLIAGTRLERGGRLGVFLTMILSARLSLFGVTVLKRGRKTGSAGTEAVGVLNLSAGLAVAGLLGACWYSIDPLGLHWPAVARGATPAVTGAPNGGTLLVEKSEI